MIGPLAIVVAVIGAVLFVTKWTFVFVERLHSGSRQRRVTNGAALAADAGGAGGTGGSGTIIETTADTAKAITAAEYLASAATRDLRARDYEIEGYDGLAEDERKIARKLRQKAAALQEKDR